MNPIQKKIIKITNRYIKEHYDEYSLVCSAIKDKRENQKDEFASTGQKNYINQLATITPETLDAMFQKELDDAEWMYYKSKSGTTWFAKNYPEFSPAIKI